MIKLNAFSDHLKSLGYVPYGKEDSTKSVGIIGPGVRHDFGTIQRHEVITVTSGLITINGTMRKEGQSCSISPGHTVVMENKTRYANTYLCTFPDETH